MTRRMSPDQGAALITVLVMLSILSTLAIVTLESSRFSMRRTANIMGMDQIRWYVLGAESYAAGRIQSLTSTGERVSIDQSEWQGRPFVCPLDNGVMTLTLWDGGNCLNLNSLIQANDEDREAVSPVGFYHLARLLDLLQVKSGPAGLALSASLADWIDADQVATHNGAEDEAYRSRSLPYRPANTLLSDVSELRRIVGFDDETVRQLAPSVCVRPSTAGNPINIDSIRIEQAPLLAAVLGASVTVQTAQQVINDRPKGGWESVDAFFNHPRLSSLELSTQTKSLFSQKSTYYVLVTRIEHAGMTETAASLMSTSGAPRTIRRVLGVGAAGRVL